MGFSERLDAITRRNDSLLCIGLDPDIDRIPSHLRSRPDTILTFNRAIIEATADLVCAYKPNLGFYLAHGATGIEALIETRKLIPNDIPVILDAKVGDIPTTSAAYARAYFDAWGFDAVTAHPYLGADSLEPFLRYEDRAVFVLARTSNPRGGDLQDLAAGDGDGEPLYLRVAHWAQEWRQRYGTAALVVGATRPAQLAAVRARCSDMPILVPGVGAQGGDLEATVGAGLTARGDGLLINASRTVIYAGQGADFADQARAAALQLRDAINHLRTH